MYHKNPRQRRERFNPGKQRTLNSRTLESPYEVAQAQQRYAEATHAGRCQHPTPGVLKRAM
jgi:hypothetical protein